MIERISAPKISVRPDLKASSIDWLAALALSLLVPAMAIAVSSIVLMVVSSCLESLALSAAEMPGFRIAASVVLYSLTLVATLSACGLISDGALASAGSTTVCSAFWSFLMFGRTDFVRGSLAAATESPPFSAMTRL